MNLSVFRRTIGAAFALIVCVQCSAVDLQINDALVRARGPQRVMILPFQIEGAGWGQEFADSLGLQLANTGRFIQVERGRELQRLLQEQRFSESGLIDTRTRLEIGRLTSANLIITGHGRALTMRGHGGELIPNVVDTCTVRAVDVESGEHVITLRKRPGRAWTNEYRAKYFLTLTLGWDLKDILRESANFDEIARQFATNIDDAIQNRQAAQEREAAAR